MHVCAGELLLASIELGFLGKNNVIISIQTQSEKCFSPSILKVALAFWDKI